MRHAVRAYTLVELLLTISIIAVLISLLLPALGAARQASHDAVCLSNLKQVGAAWNMYDQDFEAFPWGDAEDYSVRFGWGGVHWYGLDDEGNPLIPHDVPAQNLLTAERPLNPYLGQDITSQAFARNFRCPADHGINIPGAERHGEPTSPWESFGLGNLSGEGEYTVFGQLGTSYEANRNMYRRVDGLDVHWGAYYGSKDVHVNPSRFVIVGDAGAMTIAESGLYQDVVVQGWWHGFAKGQLAYLDGSARHETVIGDPKDYTFYRLPR